MIVPSRSVIGAGGLYFVVEVAEVAGFVVAAYRGGPFFCFFVPVDAFVFGASVR